MSAMEPRRSGGARAINPEWQDAAERRRSARRGNCPPLHVEGMAACVHDISRGGICLLMQQPVELGERYPLILVDALSHGSQNILGEVVWRSGDHAGLRWVDLTPDQDHWLLQRFQSWLAAMDGASRR